MIPNVIIIKHFLFSHLKIRLGLKRWLFSTKSWKKLGFSSKWKRNPGLVYVNISNLFERTVSSSRIVVRAVTALKPCGDEGVTQQEGESLKPIPLLRGLGSFCPCHASRHSLWELMKSTFTKWKVYPPGHSSCIFYPRSVAPK